jgi:hypothetical protein
MQSVCQFKSHIDNRHEYPTHLRNNTSRSNSRALTNPHPRQNHYIPSNPAVRFNVHFLPQLWPIRTIPHVGIKWVRAAVDGHVGSDQSSCSDGHQAGIDDGAIEVDEDAGAETDVCAVVYVDWGFDPGV